VSYILNFR